MPEADIATDALRSLLSETEERLAVAERNAVALELRLEGVYRIAAEMLADDAIDTVLSRIAGQAGRAVEAERYLLVASPSGGIADLQVHQRGFELDEALSLASELLKGSSPPTGGSLLVCPIASTRRSYGHIVAERPSDRPIAGNDALKVYADFAAAALDLVTALDESRRAEKISTTLLSFAGDLAHLATTDQIAVGLARALIPVIGCTQVWVLTPEENGGRYLLRSAVSSGTGAGGELEQLDSASGDHPPTVAHPGQSEFVGSLLDSTGIRMARSGDADPFVKALVDETGAAACLAVAIRSMADTLGLAVGFFDDDDDARGVQASGDICSVVVGLANQAGMALANAKMVDQITHMAWHDTLTGLPNRRLLTERGASGISVGSPGHAAAG